MTSSWTEPAIVLIEQVPRDLGGLWSLLYASELAAVRLNVDPGVPLECDVVGIVIDLREGVEELEWQYPDTDRGQAAVDMGPPVRGGAVLDGVSVVCSLLLTALQVSTELIRDPQVVSQDVLMLARLVTLVVSAYVRLTGHLP